MLSSSRRPSLCLQLIRHFSVRVSSLKKQSLVAQLLRRHGSPKLTKSTQRGALFHDPGHNKATHLLPQGEASLRSVCSHPLLGLSAELPGLENGRQKDKLVVEDDACSDHIAKLSVRSKKEFQRSDVSAKLSVLSLREGSKADHCEGETELPVLSKLSVPSRIERSKAHHSIGDTQQCVRAQAGSKRGHASDCEGKVFQTESRKVDPAEVSVQPQEEGCHSHVPLETKPGRKSLALQTQGASQNPCRSVNKLGISPLNTGFSKEISSLASEFGDEHGKCITFSSENDEEDDVQNAVKRNLYQLKSAVAREINKRLEVEKLVELYSEMIRKEVTDNFLNDWQRMSIEMDNFFNELQQKVELVSVESVPLIHVKALLMNREFLSASPKKFSEVFTILKLFFESGDKACELLTSDTKMIVRPLEKLQQQLKVFVEFEVDKATCYRVATSEMRCGAEKIRRLLSFLKDLGLSAESRNRFLYNHPYIIKYSVENRLQPIVNFFESIEVARATLLKLLELRPLTLIVSLDKDLKVMHKLFQYVGLSATEFAEAMGKVSYKRPDPFLVYNVFREQGLSDEAFASMIKRNPEILCLSVKTLKAKLDFLLHKAKRDISEVLVFPYYFNYSLANRIIPRFKLLEELNLPRQPSLSRLMIIKNLDFLTAKRV